MDKGNITRVKNPWYYLAFFFVLAFSYFFWFGNYVLFFQEQQSLFLYSAAYINDFFVKPGGLLDLAGRFLTQFYITKFAGSIILAAVLSIPGIILIYINRRLMPGSLFSIFLILIPSCLLMLMQTHYYHLMMYNLGFLLVIVYFHIWLLTEKKTIKYLVLVIFPLFFYLTGAYAVIFICLFILYSLLYIEGPRKYYYTLFILVVTGISAVVFNKILLLQTFKQLALFPLPFINDSAHKFFFWLLTGLLILYPVICRLTGALKPVRRNIIPAGLILPVIVFAATVIILITGHNSQTARVINVEKLVFEEKWEEAVEYQEKYPAENLIGEFFYNVALSETDQLCDRLFYGRQDFGTASLILGWSSEHLNWGAYSFYTTGLINEAQRWAYEEMVVYGMRPQNMKMLTKTSLLTGNYRLAMKYTGIMKNSLFYKPWAREFEKLAKDTALVRSHPELGKKLKILPGSDFFIHLESPEANLPLLVDENPGNRRAFEYMMSWLLLGKNVDILVNNIRLMKNMGYTRIPRHIEEAILIYYNSMGKFPDLGGLPVSSETMMRFDQYFAAYMQARQNPSLLQETMKKDFGNTFWYYFHFK